ncbi:MAG: MBOAT family protein [Deltaproteobacteria bacterium]|nr:MBOAT family protein [Deltaproteobacteria bacterium]
MLFNSIDFAVFLPTVFVFYWFVTNRNLKIQNFLIVVASYLFYGWWDWRFLLLIAFSTLVDYSVGLGLAKKQSPNARKMLFWISILVNLGFLGFFKYFGFFLDNFIMVFSFLGKPISVNSLNIILPVGISFYTFQKLSYTIDVYRRKLEPTNDFIAFAAFVSFFPQLVAGPIERATHLLPQFFIKRRFAYPKAVDGLKQILWGMFKKVVIADNCAEYANMIFNNSTDYNGSALVLGVIFFSIQIYGDFSGYSDIAIGASRLFGFNLKRNFAYPYFSRDIAEFWRRWHISLLTWFRDYLYIPLGGSRVKTSLKIRNTFIVFLVSGLWHGANWTFIVWGALHVLYFLPLLLLKRNRNNLDIVAQEKYLPTMKEFINMVITFSLVTFAWIFFRAESIGHAFLYINGMLLFSLFHIPNIPKEPVLLLLGLILAFVSVEWVGREDQFAIECIGNKQPQMVRWSFYSFIIFAIGMYMQTQETPFIYFQF